MKTNAILALSLLFALACDATEEPPAAEIVENTAAETPSATPAATNTLSIDSTSSSLGFVGHKVVGSHTGQFEEWQGEITLGDSIEESRVEISIDMRSIEADEPRLTRHLRSDDFFAVQTYPSATFESVSIAPAPAGDSSATHLITGRLSLRGQTQTVTFPTRVDLTASEVRARADFSIDRQRWGISYRGMEDNLIQDEVEIRFDLRAPRNVS